MESALDSTHAPSLLSPRHYEDDVSSTFSERSDQDTDSEDDKVLKAVRTSADIRAYDRGILVEEEELGRLLMQEKRRNGSHKKALGLVRRPLQRLFSQGLATLPRPQMDEKKNSWKRHRKARQKKKAQHNVGKHNGEEGHLMFEMEEGVFEEDGLAASGSDAEADAERDRRRLLGLYEDKRRRARWRMCGLIHLTIAFGLSILVLVFWKVSLNQKSHQGLMNNGTALFAPTTILISLDGFRADFLQRGITPRMNALIKEGVSPPYMRPSFPSVTFPNHYTLVTGLHPESHGIVGNTFWDEELKSEFIYTGSSAKESKWWRGEPIWVTAEKQGVRTAIHMWPGSEAHIMGIEPTFLDKYDGKLSLKDKASRVLEFLDKPGIEDGVGNDMRPQLIAAYVPNVDVDGHSYGPNSTEIKATITEVDHMLDEIFVGLEQRNLTNIVNVMVVSDHGMATTDINRMIQLENHVDPDKIKHIDGWPLYGLHPKGNLEELYQQISDSAATSNDQFDVYLRDKNMPKRYHFSNNERIAPLWIVPKAGWAIVTKKEFDIEDSKSKGLQYHPRGLHGYDNEHPLMRAIFIARGPAFPQALNSRFEPFQNIEVYNIICDSLGLIPQLNNGTIRLPILPISVDQSAIISPALDDPEIKHLPTSIPESTSATPTRPVEISSAIASYVQSTESAAIEPPEASGVSESDTSWMTDKQKELWGWMKGNAVRLKEWLEQLVPDVKKAD